jgi:hypothetical protein
MNLTKAETNNAIIIRLKNVRKHPNADRLKLATVLGTTVVVGLEAKENDLVVYFDSNLRLSPEYLFWNNLYSNKEMNSDSEKKGYFGKHGRVKAQNFRGEPSNGYIASLDSLDYIEEVEVSEVVFNEGDEFTHINDRLICEKCIPLHQPGNKSKKRFTGKQGKNHPKITMFHKHWNTKQLMREVQKIDAYTMCWFEEKIHGTSGRIGHVLVKVPQPWWKFWAPKYKEEWRIVGGTRRIDHSDYHIPTVRKDIEEQVAPHLHKGEQIYFEIYGYDEKGVAIQDNFAYGCHPPLAWDHPTNPKPYRAMLYRVTITTPDGFIIDLDREDVYRRAEELGLEKPHVFAKGIMKSQSIIDTAMLYYKGQSALDKNTMREGVVVWFKIPSGHWKCLKHKSEEFLIKESGHRDKGKFDVEDEL